MDHWVRLTNSSRRWVHDRVVIMRYASRDDHGVHGYHDDHEPCATRRDVLHLSCPLD